MDRVINTRILAHPLNWGIVWTVLLFAGVAWTLVHEYVHISPFSSGQDN